MKKQTLLKIFGSVIGAFLVGFVGFQLQSNVDALSPGDYTCRPNGSYASPTTGPGAITSDDQSRAAQAMGWLHSMTETRTDVTSASTVSPNTEHAPSYTGAISGTFTLNGPTYPTKSDASIEILSPSSVPDNYAGIIQGKVLTTPAAFRWIIQVYKRTSGGDVQVAKQALADATTGEFTIDLSDISSPPAGGWAFGILDANAGYAEYGTKWPSPEYYDGLEVQQKLVTDAIYDWNTTKALADGTFTFPNSNTGKKLFRLVDTASGDILAEHVEKTGLIRSFEIDDQNDPAYGTALEDQSYVYDQAVALFAAIGSGDDALASSLADGLLNLQEGNGGFAFAAPQLSPMYRDSLIRTGAHAIAVDALLSYVDTYPLAVKSAAYRAAAESGLAFLDSLLSQSGETQGLYLGGYGDYTGPSNSFDPNIVITWASTEHNIDIWNTFVKAARVLGSAGQYAEKAAALSGVIKSKLYSAAEHRLFQGMRANGVDTADPLDVNSWGAMQLYSSGHYDEALLALARVDAFKFTRGDVTGYAPFYDSAGYPGAEETVWFEGSYGVALARYHIGDYQGYRDLLGTLADGQESDGSFRYATDEDVTYSITTRKSVASTAWFILATTGRSAIWNVCMYNPPAGPIEVPEVPIVTQPVIPVTPKPSIPSAGAEPEVSAGDGPQDETPVANVTPEVTPVDGSAPSDEDIPQSASDQDSKSDFSWTPIIIAGSFLAGAGLLWGLILFIRSRLR